MAYLNLRCNCISESALSCLAGLYELDNDYLIIESWQEIGDCWIWDKNKLIQVGKDF